MSDSSKDFQINLATTADTSGATKAADALKNVGNAASQAAPDAAKLAAAEDQVAEAAKRLIDEAGKQNVTLDALKESAKGFLEAVEMGSGIAIGEKLVEGLGEVVAKFKEAAAEGVEFDKEMESLGIGIAASLRQAAPEKYLDWSEAKTAGVAALDAIKSKANELGLDVKALAESVQVNMLALTEGGIRDINQQVEASSLLMQAAAAKGVNGMQAMRDVMDLLQGRAERVVLAKELGISNEDISKAKEAGTLFEFLTSKLGAYKDAAADTAQSLTGLEQTTKNLFSEAAGEAMQPAYDELKKFLAATDEWIAKNPQVAEEFRTIVSAAVQLVEPLGTILRFTADMVEPLAHAAEYWFKFTGLAKEVDAQARLHVDTLEEINARQERITAAHARTIEAAKSTGAAIEGQRAAMSGVASSAEAAAESEKKGAEEIEKAAEAAEKLGQALEKGAYARLDPDGKVRQMQVEIDGVREKLSDMGDAANSPQEAFDNLSKFPPEMQLKMIPLIEEWNKLGEKMAEAFHKAEGAAGKLWEKLSDDAFAKLDDAGKLKSLTDGIEKAKARLHDLGVDEQSPLEALKKMMEFPPDAQAKMEPLIAGWERLKEAREKALKDADLKDNDQTKGAIQTQIAGLENDILGGALTPKALDEAKQKITELKKALIDLGETRKAMEGKPGDPGAADEAKRKLGLEAYLKAKHEADEALNKLHHEQSEGAHRSPHAGGHAGGHGHGSHAPHGNHTTPNSGHYDGLRPGPAGDGLGPELVPQTDFEKAFHGGLQNGTPGDPAFKKAFGSDADNHQIDTRTGATKKADATTHNSAADQLEARADQAINDAASQGENPEVQRHIAIIEKLIKALDGLKSGNRNDRNGKSMKEVSDKLDRAVEELSLLKSQFHHM
jgi:hypothetical protein